MIRAHSFERKMARDIYLIAVEFQCFSSFLK